MKNYVFIYHSDQTTPPTKEALDTWGKWFETLGEHLVDSGSPLQDRVFLEKGQVKKDKADTVVGYSVVKAKDMDEAVALAKDCPLATTDGCFVTVYETGEM